MQIAPVSQATPNDYEVCRRLHHRYGKTYYYATRFFPREIRPSVHALYGFVRCPDEWVDNPNGEELEDQRDRLVRWRSLLDRAAIGLETNDPVMRAFGETMRRHRIPAQYAHDFIDAMEMDLDRSRYQTYQDLEGYMWGSASVIGVMMCFIVGVEDPAQHSRARALGNAMQLTNFLRDIGEDWARGRVYLPQEDLERFGVSEHEIADGRVTPRFCDLMAFEIQRTRELYAEADEGIDRLPGEVRFPIRLARRLYSQILDKIEQNDYDVFSRRASTSLREKLAATCRLALR